MFQKSSPIDLQGKQFVCLCFCGMKNLKDIQENDPFIHSFRFRWATENFGEMDSPWWTDFNLSILQIIFSRQGPRKIQLLFLSSTKHFFDSSSLNMKFESMRAFGEWKTRIDIELDTGKQNKAYENNSASGMKNFNKHPYWYWCMFESNQSNEYQPRLGSSCVKCCKTSKTS